MIELSPYPLPRAHPEPSFMRGLRRSLIAFAAIYAVLCCWGTYRRIWQVLRVDVNASSTVLVPGSTLSIDVITTGEVRNRVLLELVQGSRTEALLDFEGRLSSVNTLDPRVFRYTGSVTLTPQLLSRFHAGAAMLRLTGFGGQKLLRTPAPRTRTLTVRVGESSAMN